MAQEQISASKPTKKDRLRLVLVVSEITLRDYREVLKHLLVGIADESIPVALVCPPNSDVEEIVSPGVEVIRYPTYEIPFMWRRNKKLLLDSLSKFEPTLIHCFSQSQMLLTRYLATRLDLPYILSVNALQSCFERHIFYCKKLEKVIVPAASIAADFARAHPKLAGKEVQINMGAFAADDCSCFIESNQLASMVVAHPMDKVGDFESVLSAVRHLAIDGHEFILVMIGGGRSEKRVRKLVRTLGLMQIVTIVPRIEPWDAVLRACDIFIRPVVSQKFDYALLEAMNLGCAVAGCNGGVDDLIVEDNTAVVFDADDELSIYSSLQQLLDNRELARQLAENGQKHLKENHSVSKMILAILEVYRQVQKK